MGAQRMMIVVVMLQSWSMTAPADIDCSTVTGFLSACSTFISYGSPDPLPGSPCCDAMMSLNEVTEAGGNRRSVCSCLMGLISTYNPNASAIATLPGFCGVSLGFVLDPNTDCTYVP